MQPEYHSFNFLQDDLLNGALTNTREYDILKDMHIKIVHNKYHRALLIKGYYIPKDITGKSKRYKKYFSDNPAYPFLFGDGLKYAGCAPPNPTAFNDRIEL